MKSSYSGQVVLGFGSSLVTPSDNNLFTKGYSRGLWIGTAGTINITFPDGTTADNMPAKEGFFPYNVLKVRAGGSASDIWTIS